MRHRRASRRVFLRSGAALAAAPWLIPASALGADGSTAASNRITLGFIGVGCIARWTGRALKWDPAREEFLGDDDANRMRGRAMREPWRV